MTRSIPALARGLCLIALVAVRLALATAVHGAQAKGPVQVYILAGQSNMDGQAHVRTIDFLGEDDDPARAALLKTFKPDGTNLVSRADVWVANGGYHGDLVAGLEKQFPTYDPKAGYRIAGFVWLQGYNDLGCTKEDYSRALVCLINDLRRDLQAPDMKAVVGVLGVNGPKNEGCKQVGVREGQRFINTVPEFEGNARAIETAPLLHPLVVAVNTQGWLPNDRDFEKQPITAEEKEKVARATSNKGFHYYGEGRFFILLGKAFAETMLQLMGKGQPAVARP